MAKSNKFNFYIDSTGITHNRKLLSDILYDSGWIDCTLNEDFSHLAWNRLKYRKKNGIVQICGTVEFTKVPSWGAKITTLPSGFRPIGEIDSFCRLTNNGFGIKVALTAGGDLNILNTTETNTTPNVPNSIWIDFTFIPA